MKTLSEALELAGATPTEVLDKLRVGISVADSRTGVIVLSNEEFARITGRPLDLLMRGQITFVQLTHPDDRAMSLHLEQQLLSGQIEQYSLAKRYVRLNGDIVWVNLNVGIIQRSNEATLSIALVTDVTANRPVEAQVDATEIVAKVATWNWSVQTNTTTVSPAYNALYGLPRQTPAPSLDEAIKRVHPDDRKRFRRTVIEGWNNHCNSTGEYRIVRNDGQVRWVRTTTIGFYDADGKLANLIGASIDITDSVSAYLFRNVPEHIREIQRHIEINWDKPLSLRMLAASYGVSTRSIYNSFAANGTTPNKFLKKIRLMHARQKLLASEEKATVTEIALQCGFSNLGHFAKDYRGEFNEYPSETLRKRGNSQVTWRIRKSGPGDAAI